MKNIPVLAPPISKVQGTNRIVLQYYPQKLVVQTALFCGISVCRFCGYYTHCSIIHDGKIYAIIGIDVLFQAVHGS